MVSNELFCLNVVILNKYLILSRAGSDDFSALDSGCLITGNWWPIIPEFSKLLTGFSKNWDFLLFWNWKHILRLRSHNIGNCQIGNWQVIGSYFECVHTLLARIDHANEFLVLAIFCVSTVLKFFWIWRWNFGILVTADPT